MKLALLINPKNLLGLSLIDLEDDNTVYLAYVIGREKPFEIPFEEFQELWEHCKIDRLYPNKEDAEEEILLN